ncbi:MAG: hypothetical protein JWM01_84 [Arthrobacter sp.]|jgi:hypothetical protein|nr:hypothetical protein [Arthrobacter sp.]MCU1522136.1 hypothetical protein [Arthrobacter sp.]MCU1539137.1 hypothetical protein [Arthrobacter sp.]MCU1555189.1 hypothetical protein [Arthrobacter sp.]
MSEMPEAGERRHSEAPAEGDPDADASEIRVHSQEPAEGPDAEDTDPDRVPPTGAGERRDVS